jgi:SPP1 gp7 family putative phage head morphogenesis protein
MENIEKSFVSAARKFNRKRKKLIIKELNELVEEMYQSEKVSDRKRVLKTYKQLPASKEWGKIVKRLNFVSVETGILRADEELIQISNHYESNKNYHNFDDSIASTIQRPLGRAGKYDREVVLPKEAIQFLNSYSLAIADITDETTLDGIKAAISRGLDEGATLSEMKKQIQDATGTWLSDWRAENIARTEATKMYNAGRIARYSDPDINGFVEALQYDSVLDARTTEICQHMANKIVPITDKATINKYTPPNHYQCRAAWLPVTRYEEWSSDVDSINMEPMDGFKRDVGISRLTNNIQEPLVQRKK